MSWKQEFTKKPGTCRICADDDERLAVETAMHFLSRYSDPELERHVRCGVTTPPDGGTFVPREQWAEIMALVASLRSRG